MYAKFTGNNILDNKGRILKPRHHVKLDLEFCLDCVMWENFLTDLQSIVWPFVDMQESVEANTLNFFTDAAARDGLAYGVIFGDKWLFGQWEKDFVKKCKHSIAFLELFALCAGIMTWAEWITKIRIVIFCDNISVVSMVNNLTSGCFQCMKLIRMLTLNNLKYDHRVFICHVEGRKNILSNALSRQKIGKFLGLAPRTVNKYLEKITEDL